VNETTKIRVRIPVIQGAGSVVSLDAAKVRNPFAPALSCPAPSRTSSAPQGAAVYKPPTNNRTPHQIIASASSIALGLSFFGGL
jgi:hypothetical protein